MYLGLDLSLTHPGFCALYDSQTADVGTANTKDLVGVKRIQAVVQGIREFMAPFGGPEVFRLAAIEGYSYGSTGRSYALAELGGTIRWHLEREWGIPFIVVPPSQLKRFVTGYGNADKVQVCNVLLSVYQRDFLKPDWPGKKKGKEQPEGWGLKDEHWFNDEADAFCLANVAALYDGQWDRPATHDQIATVEAVRLDPMGLLTAAAKERNAKRAAAKEKKGG